MGVAFAPLMAGVGLAGAGVSAAGSIEAGNAGQAAAAYRSQVAANNAKIAQTNARMDIQAGEVAATNQGLKTRAKVGEEKAAQGAAGVDVNTGSAVDVRAGTAEIGMLDALTVRSNAAKQAYGQLVNASNYETQSKLDLMEGEQAKKAGEIGAISSLLGGASTVGGNYAKWQTQYGTPRAGIGESSDAEGPG